MSDHDAQNEAAIITAAGVLAEEITEALSHTGHALHAVNDLAGPLYDVEMAESVLGDDARHELESALRSLRHVQRIAESRTRMLEG